MTVLEILVKARELIATPKQWVKGYLALGRNERMVGIEEIASGKGVDIYCFCIEGALVRAGGRRYPVEAFVALGFGSLDEVTDWNDASERTHVDVLARFDRAIAKLQASAVQS